jgi:hypothetical protein
MVRKFGNMGQMYQVHGKTSNRGGPKGVWGGNKNPKKPTPKSIDFFVEYAN